MRRRLPPLNALLAFEAAARHLSFTTAAEELYVTPAAISHQIKALEEHLGVKLFHRLNRVLRLTTEGQIYSPAVQEALDRLGEATVQLQAPEGLGTLSVSVVPSFAARWLVPRLGRFREIHPEIDVRVVPAAELVDFARSDIDVGIRYGRGQYPVLRAERLLEEEIFPVCSPVLLTGPYPLRQPQDLCPHTLLHDEGYDDWRTWLLMAGVQGIDPSRGPIFTRLYPK